MLPAVKPLSLIGRGASADVLRLDEGRVIKLFHPGVDVGTVHRELECARRAGDVGVAVPRVIGRQMIEGREGIVFEEVPGHPLMHGVGIHLGKARDALRKLAETHADIHRRGARGLYHQQQDILHIRILAADCDDDLRFRALDRLFALKRGQQLCHGDFHPRNAIQTTQGIVAIDWSSGCAGDPAGDVARTEILLRFGMYGRLLRKFRPMRWTRHLAADFYLKHYARVSGMAMEQVHTWRLPVAVACLVKGSAIYRRSLRAALTGY